MQIVNGNKDRPEYISVEMNNNGEYHLYDVIMIYIDHFMLEVTKDENINAVQMFLIQSLH